MLRSLPEPVEEPPPPAPLGRRQRNRLARHRSYLAAAQAIVSEDGLDGLTMQRMADRLDCAVGTIYTYFPSKSALLAELQRTAIEKLTASYLLLRADLDRLLAADEPSERIRRLARLVAVGRFWAATTESLPQEAQLMQMLMAASGEVMSTEDGSRVLPAAARHLDLTRAVIDEAQDGGVIDDGDAWSRVVAWLAAVNGVVQVSRLAMWDAELLDGARLAALLSHDLVLGWGASTDELARAETHILRLEGRGPLAPPVPETSEVAP
jgi:AcrR family transcriptional regulator